MAEDQIVIGIDLGTSSSCCGYWDGDHVEIATNGAGSRKMPSYVAFLQDRRLSGEAAKNQAARNARNTVFCSKRFIGRRYSNEGIRSDARSFMLTVTESKKDRPAFSVTHKGIDEVFSPEEISATIISQMVSMAESCSGKKVGYAVVSVPSYFSLAQRQATLDAATIAGVKRTRLLNEGSAAALAFVFDRQEIYRDSKKVHKLLVYDLGGGSFEASVVVVDGGIVEVKTTDGNTRLGGEDFDSCLIEHFVQDFRSTHGHDIATNPKSLRRLRDACERAKCELSAANTASIDIEALYEDIDYRSSITRQRFEQLCMHLFLGTLTIVERALSKAGLAKGDVDEVLLVGGSTRIPKVHKLLQEFFNGKNLCRGVNADEAVAHGATLYAAASSSRANAIDWMLLIDIIPRTICFSTNNNKRGVLFEAGTTIPSKRSWDISVLKEFILSERDSDGRYDDIGRLEVAEPLRLRDVPKDIENVILVLELEVGGFLVRPSAEYKVDGETFSVEVPWHEQHDLRPCLAAKDRDDLAKRAMRLKAEDAALAACDEARNALEKQCYVLLEVLKEKRCPDKESSERKKQAERRTTHILAWIEANGHLEHPTEDKFRRGRHALEGRLREAEELLDSFFAFVEKRSESAARAGQSRSQEKQSEVRVVKF